jgi:hypothetical protein
VSLEDSFSVMNLNVSFLTFSKKEDVDLMWFTLHK